ncbi:MAG: 50S ribosomal protein L28 [Candidatus Shikimatogenerans sp. JK-2022]|nr:50S ribosomal protein L28 [Candidatus Shikimatogenerans bostrichidophilus]MDH3005061.1 50S ribosomal protein L28 [Candidatus Shikimatogenerans bostrichidophilus]
MSKICSITNKKPIKGYKKSDSNRKTKRWFKINIFKKKIYDILNKRWIKIKVSTYGLRLIKKYGLNLKFLKNNVKK